ncbi:polysaccharide biosynthesis/export family protein [Alsobacter sp. SYSU M60028]|uniref:Polysaccharide biosynthesis/export family protein n=1 Tax=Alsobacter ponti TaxID=2962936 RepID=A0ABT1LD14_9HYPH|nr:polysaccharide biosynthesis/export family protein [Alsobacter ponti]MCP8938968.1 polysaccharide biosynthesis/export family protein [Alsobacter ponti]
MAVSTLALAGWLAGVSGASAQYRIQTGDVLEIAVAGVPELRQRVPVSVDGEISYPLIGQLKVAGMPLTEARDTLRTILPTRIYQQRTPEGRTVSVQIISEEVTVSIVEYRPIYLRGDVAKPGEQTFRPGLTVRQAIALAGGFDIMRFRMSNPFLEAADLRSEYDSLWLDFAKGQTRIARLQAELDGRTEMPKSVGLEAPIPEKVAEQIAEIEAEQLRVRTGDVSKEKAFLEATKKQAEEQVNLLADRQDKEAEGVEADRREADRVRDLLAKGTVPMMRMTEARRNSLLSATQWLQTTVQRSQSERQVEEIGRQIAKVDDQRRLDILTEVQDVNVKLAATRSRLEAVAEKLLYTGAIKSQLVRGKGEAPDVVLYRKDQDGQSQKLQADESTELQPGDVIDVALPMAPVEAMRAQ